MDYFINFLFDVVFFYSLMLKTVQKLDTGEMHLNITKAQYNSSTSHIILNIEMLKSFILKIRNKSEPSAYIFCKLISKKKKISEFLFYLFIYLFYFCIFF